MKPFYATSRHGIKINYKCYKEKKPFRPLCDIKDPEFSDCVKCEFFRAEMRARDAERLMTLLEKRQ